MSTKYVASLDYEARKHYLEKLSKDGSAVSMPDPYSIPEELWNEDVTKWPSVEFGDVYTYLIETRGPFTKDKLKAYKSLEAYNYFYNGYVRTVSMYCCEGDIAILKAKVNPSQKAPDKNHKAWAAVCMQSGCIRTAHCTFMPE